MCACCCGLSTAAAVLLVSDKCCATCPLCALTVSLLCFRTQRTNAGFDAVLQFRDRVSSYIANGHPIDKIEILVLGGTWSEYPEGYQVRVVVASDSAVCPGCFFLFSGGRFLCGTFAAAAKLAMLCTRLF